MGNHEFCEDCGESSFHNHRDCDPEKVRKLKEQRARNEAIHQSNIARMKTVLANHGISYTLDEYGYASISPSQFAEGGNFE